MSSLSISSEGTWKESPTLQKFGEGWKAITGPFIHEGEDE